MGDAVVDFPVAQAGIAAFGALTVALQEPQPLGVIEMI
jgi:hypothetical protein